MRGFDEKTVQHYHSGRQRRQGGRATVVERPQPAACSLDLDGARFTVHLFENRPTDAPRLRVAPDVKKRSLSDWKSKSEVGRHATGR